MAVQYFTNTKSCRPPHRSHGENFEPLFIRKPQKKKNTTVKQKKNKEGNHNVLRQRFRHLSEGVRAEGRRQHGIILHPCSPVRRNASQENNRVESHPADGDHDREGDKLLYRRNCFRRNVCVGDGGDGEVRVVKVGGGRGWGGGGGGGVTARTGVRL